MCHPPKRQKSPNQDSNQEPKAQIQVFSRKAFYFYKIKWTVDLRVSLINHRGLLSPSLETLLTVVLIWTMHTSSFWLSQLLKLLSSFFYLFSPVSNFCVMETNHPFYSWALEVKVVLSPSRAQKLPWSFWGICVSLHRVGLTLPLVRDPALRSEGYSCKALLLFV